MRPNITKVEDEHVSGSPNHGEPKTDKDIERAKLHDNRFV
jgi:hypothetical protein